MDVRAALLESAITVFAESGSRGATTRRIALAAGVNEVTLFRHFKHKEELIQAAVVLFVSRMKRPALPAEPVAPREELLEWSRAHYRELYRNRAFIRKVMSEHEEHPGHCSVGMKASTTIAAELTTYLVALKRAGLASGDWDERAACSLLMGALFSDAMGRDTTPERYPYSRRNAVAWYVELLIRAVGADAQPRRSKSVKKRGLTTS